MDTALRARRLGRVSRRDARRREQRGRLRGIGIANYVEVTSGAPRERAEITVMPDGRVELVMGTMSTAARATRRASRSSSPNGSACRSRASTTSRTTPTRVAAGGGSHSGRSMQLASHRSSARRPTTSSTRARKIAAHLLEAERGRHRIRRRPLPRRGHRPRRSASSRSRRPRRRATICPTDLRGPLAGICDQTVPVASFPYGTHVCEVEVDPETGAVEIVGYAAVDDVGRAVNPMILHGQTHGGIAQGVGQALLEDMPLRPATAASCSPARSWITRCRAPTTLPLFATRAQRGAVADQPARRPLRRRGRHDAGARRGDQRHRRCARRIRRAPHRNAGDARARVARDPGSARGCRG